ncbi:MAG: hypothetical protein MR992_07520 [Lachnospiraceae bacterium]|nr:hypothetical protein [Lachnospiraceae bacterium]MDD7628886.1 hypothetical protein [Lachnospiraceae bacterium]MDY4120381.1 hypothetical protein [Lachnospiraceae bacterium]
MYRQGGRVVNNVWTGSAGGHFENDELKDSVDENISSNEGICRWFSVDEISSIEMPFTAKYVMEHFCKEGYLTKTLYVGVASSDKVDFLELTELAPPLKQAYTAKFEKNMTRW